MRSRGFIPVQGDGDESPTPRHGIRKVERSRGFNLVPLDGDESPTPKKLQI
jgi:hypothetical protein